MTLPSSEQEREWAAEMRDFVADHRDALAAERDAISDERDRVADAREPALDVRERGLDARAAQLGLEPMSGHEVVLQERARALRAQERTDRADRAADRVTAADARDAATKRRLDENPTTRLAAAFASIAENLYAVDSYDAVLLTIAKAAVGTVTGCDMATVTIGEHGSYHTGASTASAATADDQAQYDAGEGPALDALETPDGLCGVVPRPSLADLGVASGRVRSAVSRVLSARADDA